MVLLDTIIIVAKKVTMIDIHSHILPGIDDGADTLDDSLNLVRELASQGFTDVIATPHYIVDTTYVSPHYNNLELLDSLKNALIAENINMNVYLGNEIYINEDIVDLLKSHKLSSMNDSKYLLVELPMTGVYPNYEDVLLDLNHAGYQVILAHPERYSSFQDDFDLPASLHEAGILLQCNFGSVIGRYGKSAKKCITKLMKQKMIFAFGSDIHRCHNEPIFAKARDKISKYYNERELKRILIDNPKSILNS